MWRRAFVFICFHSRPTITSCFNDYYVQYWLSMLLIRKKRKSRENWKSYLGFTLMDDIFIKKIFNVWWLWPSKSLNICQFVGAAYHSMYNWFINYFVCLQRRRIIVSIFCSINDILMLSSTAGVKAAFILDLLFFFSPSIISL